MSYQEYDYRKFVLQRLSGSTWHPVPASTLTWSSDYTLADHTDGVPPSTVASLLIGSETATISLSRWDTVGDVLYVGDKVRAKYDGKVFFLGTVESVSIVAATDPEATKRGREKRLDITAECVGFYADVLSRIVCWNALPEEPWYPNRITRALYGLTIMGW